MTIIRLLSSFEVKRRIKCRHKKRAYSNSHIYNEASPNALFRMQKKNTLKISIKPYSNKYSLKNSLYRYSERYLSGLSLRFGIKKLAIFVTKRRNSESKHYKLFNCTKN